MQREENSMCFAGKKRGKKKSLCKEETDTIIEKSEKNILKNEKNTPESISKNAEIVYNIMSDGVCDFDSIIRKSVLEVRKVLSALTELEMNGVIVKVSSDSYRLN